MYCSNCGKEIKENVSYCPNCGSDLKKEVHKKSYNLLCIIGLIISVISFFFFNCYGIVGSIGMIVSSCGLYSCKKRKESGRVLGWIGLIIGMLSVVLGIITLVSTFYLWQEISTTSLKQYQEIQNMIDG